MYRYEKNLPIEQREVFYFDSLKLFEFGCVSWRSRPFHFFLKRNLQFCREEREESSLIKLAFFLFDR
ncbi:MAG TPA: hypothetical protein DF383_05065 [Deltaproteobacteria bacterium]|nr:hypothetical protein [Deltaproteobacteria bacterium]